jgi:hypothetical protein
METSTEPKMPCPWGNAALVRTPTETYLRKARAGAHTEEEGARRRRLREEAAERQRQEGQARPSSHCSTSACGWAARATGPLGSRCHQQCQCHYAGRRACSESESDAIWCGPWPFEAPSFGWGALALQQWQCPGRCSVQSEGEEQRPVASSAVLCKRMKGCDKAGTFRQLSRARRHGEEIPSTEPD